MYDLIVDSRWREVLEPYREKSWFNDLDNFVHEAYSSSKEVYPPHKEIFNALTLTPFDQVRVVILGQDPYHGPEQAMGLSFSVRDTTPNPPSLKNIFKEIESDLGMKSHAETKCGGDLTNWAEQGVLLLNASLTVERGKAGSHGKKGWQQLTDAMIQEISDEREGVVFMLWGNFARSKKDLIDLKRCAVLEAPHPSPLSAYQGFLGCRHFSQCNKLIEGDPIMW